MSLRAHLATCSGRYFLADIVLNFFTCYVHDGELINSYGPEAHTAPDWPLARSPLPTH